MPERISEVDPTDARAVAAIISDMRESIRRRGFIKDPANRLEIAMQTSNYEIARFIMAEADFPQYMMNSRWRPYFLQYIRTDDYRSGNGFVFAERLYQFSGGYMSTPSELAGGGFQRDALDALLAPYYTLNAASIFGPDASDEMAVEYRVLYHVALGVEANQLFEATFDICMWFLTKLIEFGPNAHLRPFPRNDDGDDEDARTRQSAADAIYEHLEALILSVYLLHARQQLDDHPIQELAPKLCEAVQVCPQFRQRVANGLLQTEIDVLSICDPVAAAEVAAAEVVPPLTGVIVGSAKEEEEEKEDNNNNSAVVVAAPLPDYAPVVARREEIPVWARFSDPEERGVRLEKRRSPTGGGGTRRRRPRQQRRRHITAARRQGKWKQKK